MTDLITAEQGQKFKADAGKLKARLLFEGMPRALLAIAAVLSYGEQKYEAHSWKKVDKSRYEDAKFRHILEERAGFGKNDDESDLLHEAHAACNMLFTLEQRLSKMTREEFKEAMKFNKPPQGHKAEPQDHKNDKS